MVPVISARPVTRNLQSGLALVYEDRDIVVVNKPAGLLTIATDSEKTRTAVNGRMEKETEIISSYLAENKAHLVYSTPDRSKGRLARTAYRLLEQTKDFALLEID